MRNRLTIVFAIIAILACLFATQQCRTARLHESTYKSAADSLKIVRNELGQEIATIALLQGDISTLKGDVLQKDSTIRKLTKLVDKKTISATVSTTATTSKGKTETEITYSKVPFYIDTCVWYWPVYSTKWSNRWESGEIRAGQDSIYRNIKVRNEYETRQYYKKQGLFKPDIAVVEQKNLNPNTETLELRTFTVKQKPAYKILWAVGGVAAGIFLWETIR